MATIDWNLLSIIIFYSTIALFFYIKRKKIETQFKVFFLYRTEKFNKLMLKIANCCPRFWRWFGYASIPVGFLGMAFILGYLAYKLVQLFIIPTATPSLSVVIPGVHIPGSPFIPFWYGIIALFIVIMVHEGAHGIVAAANKLRIKSSGVGLMLFLPLAFVEPDEKQLARQPAKVQLGVYAAGTFSNFVTAGIIFLLTMAIAPIATGAIGPAGVYLEKVISGKPAALAGLQHGDIISYADGKNIQNATDFEKYMLSVKPGESVSLETSKNNYEVKTIPNAENKSRAYIGIEFRQNIDVRPDLKAKFGNLPMGLFNLLQLFYWIFALNIGIGIINLLPLGPIDGGRMVKALLESRLKKKKTALKIFALLTYVSLFLLLANIIIPYITKAIPYIAKALV